MNGYEPHHDWVVYWWYSDRVEDGMGEGAIPHAVFVRLTAGTPEQSVGGRHYKTRNEALQDLAQAMQGAGQPAPVPQPKGD